jgi:sortase A
VSSGNASLKSWRLDPPNAVALITASTIRTSLLTKIISGISPFGRRALARLLMIRLRMTRGMRARALRWAERAAWTIAAVALTCWSVVTIAGTLGASRELRLFAAAQPAGLPAVPSPDQRLWSPERIRAWLDVQSRTPQPPLAVLRIPRISIEVAILEGTDDWTLNRAVGHIEDTARPGADGNAGIAGHRDGFFRGLKDIRAGDLVEIETLTAIDRYRVERTWIVGPDDVSVLDPTASPAITLVTCYPFYFVGSAPQRFIVRALRTETTAR